MRPAIYTYIRYLLILFVAFYSAQSYAINNVLDHIEVQDSRDQSVVKVFFTDRLVYRSHAPKNSGDLIHVDVNFQGTANSITFENEFLSWNPTQTIPLFEVSLEWATQAQGDLVFKFNQQIKYDVQPSPDSYSITLTIYHPQEQQASAITPQTDTIEVITNYQKTAENEVLANIMEEARQAMAKEDYSKAISLYTKVLGNDNSVFAKQALEYLGVAREKKNQLAHAKKIYEQYLKRYPKGEDADRVKQRLFAMISSSETPREELRTASTDKKEEAPEWEYFGGFSQFYNRFVNYPSVGTSRATQSDIRSDLDITARRRSQNYDLTARFTGGYTLDFIAGNKDEDRISSFYFDAKDKVRGASVRFGRQSRTSGGVLGRFDGIFGDYQLNQKVKINLVAGSPVDSSKDVKLATERYFYGISADIGTINNAWDFNVFAINQRNDGLTDRQSIGGETRYFDQTKSFFSLIDYDVFYNDLNLFLFNGRWNLSENTTANASYEYRNSPILTTRNALIGQTTATSLQQLLGIFPKHTIYDLAQDRTAHSNMWFAGLTHRLNDHYQINGDIRLSKFSDTVASGGVLATQGTDLEKEYSVQLTGTSLIKEGDLAIISTTYSDLTTSDITTLLINARYPINSKLRINPKFRVRHRNNDIDGSTQNTYTPSLQLTYRLRRDFQIEAELSGDWERTELAGQTLTDRNYFFLIGYRYDF